MAFHDERFPTDVSFGSLGGPERRTDIVTLANGHEERNTPWSHSRRRYDAGIGLRSLDDLGRIVAFFEARRGPLHAFRWKDWTDYKSCLASATPRFGDQRIGTGDGSTTAFALTKIYGTGAAAYRRPIAKPVPGSVSVGAGDSELREGPDFAVDVATGLITFSAPPPDGAAVTAGFEFDVPVRFDTDRLTISAASFEAGEIPAVPVIEVRL